MQGELHDPTLLHKAEFVFTSQPADTHMQEAFRKVRPTLELAQRYLAMFCKIPPNLACGLANLCIHRVLLSTAREVTESAGVLYVPYSRKGRKIIAACN